MQQCACSPKHDTLAISKDCLDFFNHLSLQMTYYVPSIPIYPIYSLSPTPTYVLSFYCFVYPCLHLYVYFNSFFVNFVVCISSCNFLWLQYIINGCISLVERDVKLYTLTHSFNQLTLVTLESHYVGEVFKSKMLNETPVMFVLHRVRMWWSLLLSHTAPCTSCTLQSRSHSSSLTWFICSSVNPLSTCSSLTGRDRSRIGRPPTL